MKLSVLQENLTRGLGIVARAANPRSTLPVLANILFAAEAGRLRLSATNLELSIVCWVGAMIETEGAITLPAKTITELVSTLPNDRVEMALDVHTQALGVRCAASKTSIKGIDAQEFPPVPTALPDNPIRLPAAAFKAAIAQVCPSASDDEARPVLTGVHLVGEGGTLRLESADGYRLTRKTMTLPAPAQFEAVIKATALQTLAAIMPAEGDIEMAVRPGQALFKAGEVLLAAQMVEGQYPDLDGVMPRSWNTRATLPTGALAKAVRQADIFAREGNRLMALSLTPQNGVPGQAVVSAQAEETGRQEAGVEGVIEGQEVEFGLNTLYFKEVLSTISAPSVVIETASAAAPVVVRPVDDDGLLHVVMPMHIG